MKATETSTVEQLAFDGPIGVSLTIVLGTVLLAVFVGALYREKAILGSKTTVGFGVLRFLAVGTVLWILLAPINVVTQTSSTRRAVAIVTDVSASMRTTDPMGTADELRWAIAGDDSRPLTATSGTATRSADRTIAALGMARQELAAAIEAMAQHRSETTVSKYLSATQTAIARARIRLETLIESTVSTVSDAPFSGPVKEQTGVAWAMLNSPEFESFDELCSTLTKGKTPSQAGWRESLPDLEHRITGTRHVMQELTHELVRTETATASRQAQPPVMPIGGSPRIERVARFLESFKHSALDPVGADVDVQWSRFDQTFHRLHDLDALNESVTALSDADAATDRSAFATNLSSVFEQLRRLERQQPIAAAFIFSDVAHNDTGRRPHEDEETAGQRSMGVQTTVREPVEVAANITTTPVYIVPIGNTRRLRDIDLVAVEAPPVAMRNDDIVIEAHLEAHQCQGERCVVQLTKDAEVIDFREVEIDADFVSRTVRFEQRVPEIGEQSFHIAIEPVDGEMTDENNYEKIETNVTRSNIKVLLADEMPRWEFRYLAQLFRRDAKVDCDEMLFRPRLIATGKREQSGTFPVSIDQWDQYDVVILGDLPTEHLPVAAQESLIQYLRERGGTVIMIAGERAMPHAYVGHPLEDVVPVRPVGSPEPVGAPESVGDGGYAFDVTEEGRSHVALMIGETRQATRTAWEFVNRFAPLHKVSRWRRPKPAARNLIAAVPRQTPADGSFAQDSTFLCWQPLGRGRVMYLSGPDTYRLRFLRGDQLHFRFWGQLMRWAIASDLATGSKHVRIRTNKTRYEPDESVRVELELLDAQGKPINDAGDSKLRLTSATEDRTVPLTKDQDLPGLYIADLQSPKPGVYRAEPIGKTVDSLQQLESGEAVGASFTVRADLPMELVDTRCNRLLATQLSELTGGQVLPPTAVSEVLTLTNLEPVVTESIERRPLWSQWKYLWLVFGCLQIEWTIRKWRGLS